MSLLSILSFAFLTGIRHALEPDHVIAVSSLASNSKSLWRSSLAGIYWGIGHTATLVLLGMLLLFLKGEIPERVAMSMEFMVGIMLVYLGIMNLATSHRKGHEKTTSSYSMMKSVLIGFVHGLAGTAAMVLLTLSMVRNLWEGALYILIFGLGTIVSMFIFTTILGVPFVFSARRLQISDKLIRITGAITMVYGLFYMYKLGVSEGLFRLWIQ